MCCACILDRDYLQTVRTSYPHGANPSSLYWGRILKKKTKGNDLKKQAMQVQENLVSGESITDSNYFKSSRRGLVFVQFLLCTVGEGNLRADWSTWLGDFLSTWQM